jgi:hypothetical protein
MPAVAVMFAVADPYSKLKIPKPKDKDAPKNAPAPAQQEPAS